jgi:hypothetical protein
MTCVASSHRAWPSALPCIPEIPGHRSARGHATISSSTINHIKVSIVNGTYKHVLPLLDHWHAQRRLQRCPGRVWSSWPEIPH